jgi:FkbM family methyltransferase
VTVNGSWLAAEAHRYAHALEKRLFQLSEISTLGLGARALRSRAFMRRVWQSPSDTEDWVNLARFLKPSENVLLLDVGANVGEFAAGFLAIYPHSRAICFEPVNKNLSQLKKRFAGNPRVDVHHCALADRNGKAEINVHDNGALCSFIPYTEEANDVYRSGAATSEGTECRSLDSFGIKESVAKLLVKIDVQGFEIEVLRGGMATLKSADAVLLECSFANEYQEREPSFAPACALLRDCDLYPIVFQDFGRRASNYAFERDVLFVKRSLLQNIWFRNY